MSFKTWTEEHKTLWEFILFNILSNISTAARFIVGWACVALGVPVLFGNLLKELLAQAVNYFVQMKFVFRSDASYKESAPKYAVLAMVIIVMNTLLGNFGEPALASAIGNAGLANTIMSVVQTLAAVIISFPLLKFWIAPATKA